MNLQQTNKKLITQNDVRAAKKKLQDMYMTGKMTKPKYYDIESKIKDKGNVYSFRKQKEYVDALGYRAPIDNALEIAEYLPNTALFGIELEIEKSDKPSATFDNLKASILEHLPGTILITRDGSLMNGYELIFKPTSYEDLKNNTVQIAKFLKELSELGFRSHDIDTCGLHIHISKAALEPKQINAINNIITSPQWRPFLLAFSRRKESQLKWCNFDKQRSDRYHALNHKTSSQKTIEFRLFRGTLQPESFLASIELVQVLVKLAQKNKLNTRTLRPALSGNKKINAYLRTREIKLPEPIKLHRLALTPEQRAAKEKAKLEKIVAKSNLAYHMWQTTNAGLSCERAFFRAKRNESLMIQPVKVTSHQKLFKNALFTPLFFHSRKGLVRDLPEEKFPKVRIAGQRRKYICSNEFSTYQANY